MKDNMIRIVAVVVDTQQLTIYKDDGETIHIPQGDPQLRKIVDEATPQLLRQGYADVHVGNSDNTYTQFEEQSGGIVKFFRVAKEKLKKMFNQVPETSVGVVPDLSIGMDTNTELVNTLNAFNEIMLHATPVSSQDFHEKGIAQQANVTESHGGTPGTHTSDDAEDTIIAVVDNKVIPGVEKIKTQFSRANKLGSTIGVEAFLKRLAAVIDKRSHSIEDLLKFMERGDLPIADDGSILIYKVLRNTNSKGKFVDCHTRNVEQWVGAYVCMDERLVDHNRNNECSNGLHVARRGYISNFGGDVCVLAKLAPEDVIAVPSYDANKMRVCGYHIIAHLTADQYSAVKNNKPITNTEDGRLLLGKAIAGDHIGRTHEVRVTEQNGGGVKVTNLIPTDKPVVKATVKEVEALNNPAEEMMDKPTNPKDVVQQVEQLSRKGQAMQLYADYQAGKAGAFDALMTLKKASKVSWEKLGIPDPKNEPVQESKPIIKVTPKVKETPINYGKKGEKRITVAYVLAGEGSYREKIQKLLSMGRTKEIARAVLDLKRQSKKSWEYHDVLQETVNHLEELVSK